MLKVRRYPLPRHGTDNDSKPLPSRLRRIGSHPVRRLTRIGITRHPSCPSGLLSKVGLSSGILRRNFITTHYGIPELRTRPVCPQRSHARYDIVDMTFRVVLERDRETGDYSAVCPELPGCASAGQSEAEATANIREAIELYVTPGNIDLPEDAKLFDVMVG
jgi:predicted RNase H-like HicB family nuclease